MTSVMNVLADYCCCCCCTADSIDKLYVITTGGRVGRNVDVTATMRRRSDTFCTVQPINHRPKMCSSAVDVVVGDVVDNDRQQATYATFWRKNARTLLNINILYKIKRSCATNCGTDQWYRTI